MVTRLGSAVAIGSKSKVMVETGEGRVFTICNGLPQSVYLGCVESPSYILRFVFGRGERAGMGSTYLKFFQSCWRSGMA